MEMMDNGTPEKKEKGNKEDLQSKKALFDRFDKFGFLIVMIWGGLLATTSLWNSTLETSKTSFHIYRLVLAVFAVTVVLVLTHVIQKKAKEEDVKEKSTALRNIGLLLAVPQVFLAIGMLFIQSIRSTEALLTIQGILNIFMLYPVALLLVEYGLVLLSKHIEKHSEKKAENEKPVIDESGE